MPPCIALFLVAQVRHLDGHIAVQDGTERQDAADAHIHRLIHVDGPLAVLMPQDLLDEEVGRIEVTAAVRCHAAVLCQLRRDEFLRHDVAVLPGAGLRGRFLIQANLLALRIRAGAEEALGSEHLVGSLSRLTLERTVNGFYGRAVVQRHHLNAAGVTAGVTKVVELLNGRILKSDHLHRAVPGDGHDRPQRMRAIEGGAKVVAPVVRIAVSDVQPARGTVVDILTLGIGDVADVTLAVAPPHFKSQIHVAVVLGVSVDQPGLLHRLDQLDRLRHRLYLLRREEFTQGGIAAHEATR